MPNHSTTMETSQNASASAGPSSTVKRSLTMVCDPGHGWLAVENEDIKRLGIAQRISCYSYMTPTISFLEEDCDAPVFLAAARDRGWEVKTKTRHVDNKAPLRGYSTYRPEWIEEPLVAGSKGRLISGDRVTVERIQGKEIDLVSDSGARYRATSTTVFDGVLSEREWSRRMEEKRSEEKAKSPSLSR